MDIAIIGAGIAGASLAAELGAHADVLLLEAESLPGMHSTGRSAAFFAETYGGPKVQPLTTASKSFFLSPPEDFSELPLVRPRGALHVTGGDGKALDALAREFANSPVIVDAIGARDVSAHFNLLRDSWGQRGLWEPACRDIDVAALHAGYLRQARQYGVTLKTSAPLLTAERHGETWTLQVGTGQVRAKVIVNAAGAWADPVARLAGVVPLGIKPYRRTIVAADIDKAVQDDWPLVVDAGGDLYFKPDNGRLWISPHDEIPDAPADAQPRELDIAVAIDRFERATTARITQVRSSWAGLRSFSPDRLPVYGYDDNARGFFWCAGQGGFGIQTAPAAARLAAAVIMGHDFDAVDPQLYAATRFR